MNEFRVPDSKKISMVKSKINNEFNNQRTQTCCVLCGKSIIDNSKAFHKSHTVPYFCLENITILYMSTLVDVIFMSQGIWIEVHFTKS